MDQQSADPQLVALRLPPHSIEAEQSVLGGLLLNNRAWEDVADIVEEDDFYRLDHRLVWAHVAQLVKQDKPADVLTVGDSLKQAGKLDDAGGLSYLNSLATGVASAANVRHYAEMVRDRSILRRLIAVSDQIATEALNAQGRPVNEILDVAESRVFEISEDNGKRRKDFQDLGNLLAAVFRRVDELYNRDNPSEITGVATGFIDLDRMTSGLQPGDLVIIAARPSVGKTAFALNIGEHVAIHEKLPVAVFSMEMGAEQLTMRLIGSAGRIDQQRLRTGRLTEDDFMRLTEAMRKMHDAPLYIDETPALNPLELRARARRLARQYGQLGLVIVDYLQLMTAANAGRENRATEVSEISRSLKSLAKELKCPVIALSQLSREVEKRQDKKPIMSDLRECVTGDTPVLLADGRRVPIAELVGTTPRVLAMHEDGRIAAAASDRVWRVGRRPLKRLVLASGRSLRATARHRVYTGTGWQRLGDLQVGARVALSRRLPEAAEAISWPDHEVALLGQLIGDGSYLPGGERSHTKRIPAEAMRLGKRQIALLLQHLWATDGCIHIPPAGRRSAPRVYFSTCSDGLAQDVAVLLLRFGIVARLRSVSSDGARPVWTVDVSGAAQQLRFLDEVGAFGPRAVPAAVLRTRLEQTVVTTNVDTLPREVFAEVRARMSALGVSQRGMTALRGTAYGGSSHFRFAPSRAVILDDAERLDCDVLPAHATSDLFWDRVVAVEPAGEEDVYDLTVPGPASWLADGIVSHNSGAIEQDADVIFFIHREDRYDPDSDHKGMAEIIIGKQRNGPIGSVTLTFLGQYTKFENFAANR
ncbi:MAG: replicative DNA helicase [Lautropia sp.]